MSSTSQSLSQFLNLLRHIVDECRVIGADVTVFEVLGNGSIASLGQMVAARSQFVTAELKDDAE